MVFENRLLRKRRLGTGEKCIMRNFTIEFIVKYMGRTCSTHGGLPNVYIHSNII